MGAAASNRGSRVISREADGLMPGALARADRRAHRDETDRLREQIAGLERDLARARRCIAELRRSKDARMSEARVDSARSQAAILTLCLIAFPNDRSAS